MQQAFAAATGAVETVLGFEGGGREGLGVEAADVGIAARDILEEVEPARKPHDVGDAGVERRGAVGEVHAVGVDDAEVVAAVVVAAVDGVCRVEVVVEDAGQMEPGGEGGEGAGELSVEVARVVERLADSLEVGRARDEVAVFD